MPDWDAWGDPLLCEDGMVHTPRQARPKRIKRWQRKHITDEMVCCAVWGYTQATERQQAPYGNDYSAYFNAAMAGLVKHIPFPYEALAAATGAPEKVTYAACERAHDRDLIDYGVSLRTGWLTEKGKTLLAPTPSRSPEQPE